MIAPTALLVDNDARYRRSLGARLQFDGYAVIEAADEAHAVAAVRSHLVDVALIDLRLRDDEDPNDLSGLELARHAALRTVCCVIVSAFDSYRATREALRSLAPEDPLAIDYILKDHGPRAVLAMLNRLRGLSILHISDLHLEAAGDHRNWHQAMPLRQLAADVTGQPGLGMNPIKAIVLSGDVSTRCTGEGYALARQFLADLVGGLGVARDKVIIVPGNHDVDRPRALTDWAGLPEHSKLHDPLFGKLQRFLEFTEGFYGEPVFTASKPYRSWILDDRVAIVGFNSCYREGNPLWMCTHCAGHKEHYHGWIEPGDVARAGQELDGFGAKLLRIAVCHHHLLPERLEGHPGGCRGDHLWNFRAPFRLKDLLAQHGFGILLHGHRHKAQLLQSDVIGDREPWRFGSGPLCLPDRDANEVPSYLLLQIPAQRSKSRVLMRRYESSSDGPEGLWQADCGIRQGGVVPLVDERTKAS